MTGASRCWTEGGRGFARMYSHLVGFSWRPLSSRAFSVPARNARVLKEPQTVPSSSWRAPCSPGSRCLPPVLHLLRWKPHGRKARPPGGRNVELLLCSEFLQSEQDEDAPGESVRDSSDFSQEAGPVDLVERDLQVHGEKASIVLRRCCGIEAIVCRRGQRPYSRLRSRTPAMTGEESLPPRTGRWLPSSSFSAVSTGDPGDSGVWEVARGNGDDHTLEGPHLLVPV